MISVSSTSTAVVLAAFSAILALVDTPILLETASKTLVSTRLCSEGYRMARVYADVNQNMPRSYWDYDSVNISWGVLENYEVVRKIGVCSGVFAHMRGR